MTIETQTLTSMLNTLNRCLAETNANYQRLLNEPKDRGLYKEVGRSVRSLSKSCTAILLATIESQADDFKLLEDDIELADW